jgi:type II secretory pathway pseudopilin PulG
MVIGGLAGAALLVAGALWVLNRRKQQQQQQQQRQLHQQQQQLQYQAEQAYIKCFGPQQQQQQRPGVINLTADAVMCINDDSVQKV